MVLHDGSAADPPQEALLHPAPELDHRNLWRRDLDLDRDLPECDPGDQDENCHEDREPKLLGAEQGVGIASPLADLDVVDVTHDDEHPRRCEAQPSHEPVVFFKHIVVGVANPGKSTQNGNDDTDVGDDACDNHCIVLNSAIPDDVDDLINKPGSTRNGAS
jgi:hypothetical protein